MGARKRSRRLFGKLYSRKGADGVLTWYAQWREHARGRRITRSIGTNKKDAEKFLGEIEERIRRGTYATPATTAEAATPAVLPTDVAEPIFVDYAKKVIDERFEKTKAEATVTLYRANLKALGKFFGEKVVEGNTVAAKRLSEITSVSMSDYRVWRKTWHGYEPPPSKRVKKAAPKKETKPPKSISDATINRDCQFASVVLTQAVAEGLLPRNPLFGFKKLREERRGRRFMSKAEIASLLLAAADTAFKTFLVASLYTGARPCELRALRWRDVSFDNAKLTIYRSKVKNGDALDLHPVLAAELRRVLETRGKVQPRDYVFLNENDSPAWDQREAWERTLKAAGLGESGYTLYSCRHSFACHFLTGGGAITDLSAQLGHSSVQTTMIYARMMDSRRKATLLALDFGSPSEAPKPQSHPAESPGPASAASESSAQARAV